MPCYAICLQAGGGWWEALLCSTCTYTMPTYCGLWRPYMGADPGLLPGPQEAGRYGRRWGVTCHWEERKVTLVWCSGGRLGGAVPNCADSSDSAIGHSVVAMKAMNMWRQYSQQKMKMKLCGRRNDREEEKEEAINKAMKNDDEMTRKMIFWSNVVTERAN